MGREPSYGACIQTVESAEAGEWSAWRDLEMDVDPLERPDAKVRGASEPMWVGPSDGVQVQVVH